MSTARLSGWEHGDQPRFMNDLCETRVVIFLLHCQNRPPGMGLASKNMVLSYMVEAETCTAGCGAWSQAMWNLTEDSSGEVGTGGWLQKLSNAARLAGVLYSPHSPGLSRISLRTSADSARRHRAQHSCLPSIPWGFRPDWAPYSLYRGHCEKQWLQRLQAGGDPRADSTCEGPSDKQVHL